MTKYYLNTLIVVLIFFTVSCLPEKVCKNFENNITIDDAQVWLNLMPGGSGSFHFSGEYSIIDSFTNCVVKLNEVKIITEEKSIYNLIPITQNKYLDSDPNKPTEKVTYQFYSKPDIPIKDEINNLAKIDIVLVFTVDTLIVDKKLPGIEITRAY